MIQLNLASKLDNSATKEFRDMRNGKRQFDDLINNTMIISSLNPSLYFKSIIILAEGWPSWVYSIGGLFKGAKVFVSSKSSLIDKNLRLCFGMDLEWWNWDIWSDHITCEDLRPPILFCIQGASNFANDCFSVVSESFSATNVSCLFALDYVGSKCVSGGPHFLHLNNDKYLMPAISSKGYKSKTVSHSTCGGATKDKRRVIAVKEGKDLIICNHRNVKSNLKILGSPIRRSLFHVLDTTQSGCSNPPKFNTNEIFTKEDTIPLGKLRNCWVQVASVFAKSLVFRHLTMKELLSIKDLPVGMIQMLNRKKVSKDILSLIINAAPSKLLWECMKYYFTEDFNQHQRKIDTCTTKRCKIDDSNDIMFSFKNLINQYKNTEDHSESAEITEGGVAMKAVKADDAEAEDILWNELLFKRCLHIPYVHEVHAPILNFVRNTCIMRW